MSSTALIPVFNGELDGCHQQLCDARDLHQFLQVGRDFSNWIKARIEQYGFIDGEDFSPILAKSTGGRPSQEYHLSIDMAKELAMVENNDQGRQVRRYFIAMERKARESRGATYLSVGQQLAIHRQVPKLLGLLKAETSPAIRQTLYAQLCQHCHLLAIPAPSLESVGRSKPENGDLFPVRG
ncbi:anti-repressor protein [Azotobacter beijerinckii]|uniref:Anti-repressor protein n=1 Tax=Azotobacter beijerinckii TaxID=170623 RepID=A0A1H6TRY2_9GAMM|nr:antA/AntB antirepressor family protein [Azotobacter beijerinckii]SEI82818.1 anti-repressor protein [Azotobacter beijerinckii]